MEKICEICGEKLTNDDEIVSCRECDELYHLDCFEASGGCANPSCENYEAPSLSLSKLSQGTDEYDDYDDYDDGELRFTVSYATAEEANFYKNELKKKNKENPEWEFDDNYQNGTTKMDKENEDDYNESYLEDGYGNYYSPEDDNVEDNEYPSKLSKTLAYILCGIVAIAFLCFYLRFLQM